MGLINRINGTLSNIKFNTGKSVAKKTTFGFGFTSNALKKKALTTDIYQKSSVNEAGLINKSTIAQTTPTIFSDEQLAMEQPVKFIEKYCSNDVINNAIRINPNIRNMLIKNNLPVAYNLDNVNDIKYTHLLPCAKVAQGIYRNMGHANDVKNLTHLTQAALVHDIGKVFIPSEILNKAGKLTPQEREIVELHNVLGSEVIKTTKLDKDVAKLIHEHHNYDGNVVKNHENQALTIADIYCALREKRPYKKPMSDLAAKTCLYDMGTKDNSVLDVRYIDCIKS